MCIAIVKPKGIAIPEEHLHNGWLNNDDGAGFACINNEGKFIVHKSMTYAGFIDVYKEAEALYGDTSDFLIHFRITSKGDTNLFNCHPFIVDDDRVIIHNGTLYNIALDKDDKRSDTKVFAEDWLSQLPDNWEDNAVFRLMLEDFISTSKICMLHRTKGIFIFNASLGVYDNGIWYSNSGYKKYVPALIDYSQWNGAKSKSTWYTRHSADTGWDKIPPRWVACALCNEFDTEVNMMDMRADHPGEIWCYECYIKSVTCDVCNKRCAEDKADEYLNPNDNDTFIVCDKCAADPELVQTFIKCKTEDNDTNIIIGGCS